MKLPIVPLMLWVPITAPLLLAGCSDTQQTKVNTALTSPRGQLFCAFEKGNGAQFTGAIVAQVAAGSATVSAGPLVGQAAGQAVILATNATAQYTAARCDEAARAVGALRATPVPAPADPANAPVVAIPVPVPEPGPAPVR